MGDVPLVSIVTPSLNQGRFIRQTIDSVLAQDYARIEYVVIDGGSTDGTLDVLRSYGSRLSWDSSPDRGQSHAVNKGWRAARGEVLAYLNSDDFYLPGAVSRAVRFLQDRPEVVAVYGEGWHADEQGRFTERYPTEPFDPERLKETCYICQPAAFVRRSAAARGGWLDESLHYCMDYDLWLRLARLGPLGHLAEFLAVSRLHRETKTLSRRVEVHEEILKVLHHHLGFVDPSWIYGYAHAVLVRDLRRQTYLDELRFALGLLRVALPTFLRYNRRVPPRDLRRWMRWFARTSETLWSQSTPRSGRRRKRLFLRDRGPTADDARY